MKLLFIGDVVARPGRDLVRKILPRLVKAHDIDTVVANGENAAGGAGITRQIAEELCASGVDVLTSGNHIWDKRETLTFIASMPHLLRPANFPAGAPGAGMFLHRGPAGTAAVINVMGRIFMPPLDNPFTVARDLAARARDEGARVILVDFHAEASSEKQAMGWHLDGLVTAVVGTHTHVQTADERILPMGTAYITDVGMTGPHDGVIGMARAGAVARFLSGISAKTESAEGDARLHAVIVTADNETGRATGIARLSLTSDALDSVRQAEVSA